MTRVLKALADPTRRQLLDALFEQDGQTLSALEERHRMTRFGVMKHLRILEKAGLVVTRRVGREKLHFLNAVGIRQIHDRWVNKYAERWAVALPGLKRELEEKSNESGFNVRHQVPLVPGMDGKGAMAVFEIYIKTTPERLGGQSPIRECAQSTTSGSRCTRTGRPARAILPPFPEPVSRSRKERSARGRSATPTRANVPSVVERGGEGRRLLARHLGDHSGRRFLPPLVVVHDRLPLKRPCRRFMAAGRWYFLVLKTYSRPAGYSPPPAPCYTGQRDSETNHGQPFVFGSVWVDAKGAEATAMPAWKFVWRLCASSIRPGCSPG